VEVFGLSAEAVREVLAAFGPVNAVGEAFTVFKLSGLEGIPGAVIGIALVYLEGVRRGLEPLRL